ncbi:MAG: hypothetical protein PHQ54_00940 [Candidatus Omnitrophica bacterium]|nr:hypothetical protein [Candidatus Omnitrophota bacterium]
MSHITVILFILIFIPTVAQCSEYAYQGTRSENIDAVIKAKIEKESGKIQDDIKLIYNLLYKASKNRYGSFQEIMANYSPNLKSLVNRALYESGISEIYIVDKRGLAYLEFALMKLEQRIEYSGNPDLIGLKVLIKSNSSKGSISCMDMGVILMQHVIGQP